MKRKAILFLTLALCGFDSGCDNERDSASSTSRSNAPASTSAVSPNNLREPPLNVILITVDTLRADALGAYGQKRPTSPNLDRLGREGVVFLQAMSSAPSTLPSHASIMTAKYPYAHGARANAGYILPHENETLAEILHRNGYRTGAETAATVISHFTQLDQGFDHYRDLSSGDITRKSIVVSREDGSSKSLKINERTATDITDFGIEFLRKNQNNAFFLWLHYFDPHAQYSAPQKFVRLIPDSPYHAEVRYVDSEIGRLVRSLEILRLQERTLVVVTSDHGEGLMEHGEYSHASYLFETTLRVPLIFWGARTSLKNWRVDSLVRTIDIAPTILALLDLPAMKEAQGRSLVPLMTGQTADLRLTGYGESMELHSMFGSSILRCIRQGGWKYIHKLRPELYDLDSDPNELNNLASRHPEKIEALFEALRDEIRSAPARPSDARVAVDEETRLQLQALGYASAEASADPFGNSADELASLEPHGPDPSDLFGDVLEYGLGLEYSSLSKYAEAVSIFEGLAGRHPKSLSILTAHASSLIKLERFDDAVSVLHRAIEVNPEHVKAYNMLARCEESLGHLEESEAALRISLQLQTCSVSARLGLAQVLAKNDRQQEQLSVLREGAEKCPDGFEVLNNYAYLLATSSRAGVRDGTEAVRVAKLAVANSGGTRPGIIDTLAAAHAESNDFENAVKTSRRAVDLARKQGMPERIVDALEKNLDAYRRGIPSRVE